MSTVYDGIGVGYRAHRIPDARWERQIVAALGDARTVLNVGAGTGSYEPRERDVIALEPSTVMLEQRPRGAAPAIRGVAEALPFPNGTFDAALAVLTVHHWTDPLRGLAELRRVGRRQVVLTWDPGAYRDFWLVRDYLPAWYARESRLTTYAAIVDNFDNPTTVVLPVPADCTDGFGGAYWRRPKAYIDPQVRASMSGLALLDQAIVQDAMARLQHDLEDGTWHARNADLLELDELDLGYRLVIAGQPT